jgi:hypothetical protein
VGADRVVAADVSHDAMVGDAVFVVEQLKLQPAVVVASRSAA